MVARQPPHWVRTGCGQPTVPLQGATGRVSNVRPYYVDSGSPYARCLSEVYGKATVPKLKRLDDDVLHVLQP